MGKVLAISHGANATPAQHEGVLAASELAPSTAVPIPGTDYSKLTCSAWKTDGSGWCGARPAKGTELCIGHLRAEGRA